jgi:hypothetical protein
MVACVVSNSARKASSFGNSVRYLEAKHFGVDIAGGVLYDGIILIAA